MIDTKDTASSTVASFRQRFGGEPLLFRAPGRVNLIGEHTDYNDGFVMPAAINFYTYVAIRPRQDRQLAVFSANLGEEKTLNLDSLEGAPTGSWSDYVRGVAAVLQSLGHRTSGADLAIMSEVPIGSGLSSSAALEVSAATAFLAIAGISISKEEMALACQRAENEYTGARCGIMDQFISCNGRGGHALMLDCRDLSYELLPLSEQARLVICNTRVKHSVAGGEYNQRRADCERVVVFLRKSLPEVKTLRDVTMDQLLEFGKGLPEATFHRARHVISENARVLSAAAALKHHDLSRFGHLMYESHRSLRHDYEVSCRELDIMVEAASKLQGVIGARMTGGGFGGCTINLVEKDRVTAFVGEISRSYNAATGIDPEVYVCEASDGASQVQ
ncbi:MAG TPA: galactokinase [Terriglobales bacterium]